MCLITSGVGFVLIYGLVGVDVCSIMLVWPTYRIRILRRWQYRND